MISATASLERFSAFADLAPATVFYNVTDTRFQASDYTGTLTRADQSLRITSPIDHEGFQHSASGSRFRWRVVMPSAGLMEVCARYTGLVTRTETYLPTATIVINGIEYSRITQTKAAPATPHPVGDVSVFVPLAAGEHDVDFVLPICASMDLKFIRLPFSAILHAPSPRPSKRILCFGDSRVHGFNASLPTRPWPYRLGELLGAQSINIGRGGRQVTATDGTAAGAVGADAAIYLCDYNDFYRNGADLAVWGAAYRAVASNFRAASIAAGKPSARLYLLTSLDAPEALPGGTYASNNPTLEAFRARIRTEIAALADPYASVIEGLGAGMPTGLGSFADGVHPGTIAHDTIARVLAGQVSL